MTTLPLDSKKKLRPVRGETRQISDDLIARLIDHARSSPDTIAVMTTDVSLTYRELYSEVVFWKSHFHQKIQHNTVICLDRTPRLLAILLAMQWLGVTYIPVDPSIPSERLKGILEDSQAVLLYDGITHPHLSTQACIQIDLAHLTGLSDEASSVNDEYVPTQLGTAYVIYTSGSTGKPKGVAISRYALHNFLTSMDDYFLHDDHAMLLAITTIAFDIAALELYLPIWKKKTIFMANQREHKDPLMLMGILNHYPISLLQTTPSFWTMLLGMEWKTLPHFVALCGGEPLSKIVAQRLLKKSSEVWNMYGPTEATIWCSLKQIRADEPITVGRPILNMEMRVMDAAQKTLPPYVKGELYIAGVGLAQAYVNNDALTAEKFIKCEDALLGRLYQVGDLACTTPDGEFMIFGRTDNQIKLHGYRIELEEIEACILSYPDVNECAVTLYHEQLVAYICMMDNATFSEPDFRRHLALYLPDYMLPNRVILMAVLPRSLSGKLDRKALPKPVVVSSTESETSEFTSVELCLMRIWAEELAIERVGIQDNFFELGGHSLSAARIIVKIFYAMGKKVTLSDLYHAPTIVQFAERVERTSVSEAPNNTLTSLPSSALPLHDFQLMLWVSKIFESNLRSFNVAGRKRIQGPLNTGALASALQLTLKKHDVFSYGIHRFYPMQSLKNNKIIQWDEVSLLDYPDDQVDNYLAKALDNLFFNQTWQAHTMPVVAKLFYLKNNQVELHICMSHLISDEYSLDIFFKDLSDAYLFFAHQTALNVHDSFQSYTHYVTHQHHLLQEHAHTDADFWLDYLQDTSLFYCPKKYFRHKSSKRSHSTHIELSDLVMTKLQQLSIQHQVSMGDLLCAAVGLSLLISCDRKRHYLPHKLFMNRVTSTRDDPHYDNVIGCFLSINPIKLELSEGQTLLSLSKQVQQAALEAAPFQRASNLVKLSAIGHLKVHKKSIKLGLISLGIYLYSKLPRKVHVDLSVLNACKTLAAVDYKKQLLIGVNILNNFMNDKTSSAQDRDLFGRPNPSIPLHPYPVHMIRQMIDVCFHRTNDHNRPFMVITSPLTEAFQQRLAQTLISVIEQA